MKTAAILFRSPGVFAPAVRATFTREIQIITQKFIPLSMLLSHLRPRHSGLGRRCDNITICRYCSGLHCLLQNVHLSIHLSKDDVIFPSRPAQCLRTLSVATTAVCFLRQWRRRCVSRVTFIHGCRRRRRRHQRGPSSFAPHEQWMTATRACRSAV